MWLVPVEKLPPKINSVKRTRPRHKLKNIILDFMESGEKISQVVYNPFEYAAGGVSVLTYNLRKNVVNLNVGVEVVRRNNLIFLVRKDF